jgi:hypothetical protein
MNFVIELSESRDFNAILMIINRLTKIHHYISCIATKKRINAKKIARLLINYVWKLHELSSTIISDRESQFILLVWKTICRTLKINVKLSIAFHSETDDQSEIANQKMKRYLRNYCNYQQDDWSDWLSKTEFALNVVMLSQQNYSFLWLIMILNLEWVLMFQQTLQNQSENVYWLVRIRISSIKWKTSENSSNKN